MPRVFLALPLPEKVRDRLAQECDRLRLSAARVAWVAPEQLHLTLHFFGDIDDDGLLALDGPLNELARQTPPLALVARGLATFPLGEERPRVIYSGVRGAAAPAEAATEDPVPGDDLRALWESVQAVLREHHFRPERPPFRPHVTLGRVKGDEVQEGIADLLERIGPAIRREFAHFKVDTMQLVESRRLKEGPVHAPLRTFRLAAHPSRLDQDDADGRP